MVLCRPLKPKKPKKYEVLGFDIETHTRKNKFILGVFTNKNFTMVCKTPLEVQTFLNRKSTAKYIIATTNVGFDFLGTFKDLPAQQFKVAERNGIIYSCSYYQNNNKYRKINFYDSVRYFPRSVQQLGEIVGVEKSPHPSFFPNKPKDIKEWDELIAYCKNDALISCLFMENFVIKFLNENGLALKSTIASIAMNDWKTNYLKETIPVEDLMKHRVCFLGYYGGRTECFRRGKFKDVKIFDFVSLYPSVMIKEYPDPKSGHYNKKCDMYQIEHKEGICAIEGYQEKCFIPILPVRTPDKLLFPTGHIKGYYTFVELREAMKNGFKINKIGEGVVYWKMKSYFKEFVEDKFAIRKAQKANNDPLEVMTKLTLNSTYGKFCFRYGEASNIIAEDDLNDKVINNATSILDLKNGYFAVNSTSDKPPSYSFPIWGAYITAHARIKLFRAMKENQDNLAYCDTDSLFLVDGAIAPSGTELGDLEHEYSVDEAIFVRPKFYYTNKAVIKGVHTIKDEDGEHVKLNKKTFLEIINGRVIYEDRFIKFRSALRSKEHHKFGKLEVNQIIETNKKLSVEDSKRQWKNKFDPNTNESSLPLHLDEEFYLELKRKEKGA